MKGFYLKWTLVGIFVLVAVILLYFQFGQQRVEYSKLSLEEIVSNHMKAWPLPMGWENNPGFRTKDIAFRFYSQQDYDEAKVNMKYAVVENPRDTTLRFYLGVCELITGESLNSIREFNILLESSLEEYRDPARYYKSIALLKLDRKSQARRLLNETSLPEAKKLLKDLN